MREREGRRGGERESGRLQGGKSKEGREEGRKEAHSLKHLCQGLSVRPKNNDK